MKSLLVLVVLVVGVGFGYPLAAEDTSSTCDALERVTIRLVAKGDTDASGGSKVLGSLVQGLSRGAFAAVAAKDRYPSLPPGIACTVLYWRAVTNSEDFVNAAQRLR